MKISIYPTEDIARGATLRASFLSGSELLVTSATPIRFESESFVIFSARPWDCYLRCQHNTVGYDFHRTNLALTSAVLDMGVLPVPYP